MLYQRNADSRWRIFVFFDLTEIEPLLRRDLDSSERMSIEWFMASIVRFICSSDGSIRLTFLLDYPQNYSRIRGRPFYKFHRQPSLDEPCFEDEGLVELGFGFEHAVST